MVAGLAPDPDTLGKGHLTTTEIKELLGTDNLKAFVREKKEAIAERVGGNYETFYLAGKDLPGTDDPDYADLTDFSSDSYSSGC